MGLERIAELLAVARRVADPADAVGRSARERLCEVSGLSPEGVELALAEHLETDPRPADLQALQAWANQAPRCHVILSANVCTAALRAIACALATAPVVNVKASRRDPVLAQIFAEHVDGVTLVERVAPAVGDELHAYGSDETLSDVCAATPAGVHLRAHGSGIGVAAVDDADHHAAAAVANDLIAFDGRGCLSPRLVLVAGDARAFASLLHQALGASAIPRGALDDEARAALMRHRALMHTIGELFEGPHHAVAYDPSPGVLALPPPHRATLVVAASAMTSVTPSLIAAIGGDGPVADRLAARCPHARRSALGRMQKPPLDGPVDRRVSAWAARGS